MIDTWSAEKALETFVNAIPDDAWDDNLRKLSKQTYDQIISIDDDHDCSENCDECNTVIPGVEGAAENVVSEIDWILRKIRMGLYSEKLDGTLEEILESLGKELERG
jgi:hypothetical protein